MPIAGAAPLWWRRFSLGRIAPMLTYLTRRLGFAALTLALVSFVIFVVIALPPGDYAQALAYRRQAETGRLITASDIEAIRLQLGLDRSFFEQYWSWIVNIFTRGNFGFSFRFLAPVTEVIGARIGYSTLIAGSALLLTYLIALPLAVYSAVRQYSIGDYLVTVLGQIGLAVPNFLAALLLLYLSATLFGTSVGGLFSPGMENAPFGVAKLADLLAHLWVPAAVLSLSGTAYQIRVIRANLLDELGKLYVTAARARGVPAGKLLWKYPVRVAINPIVSTIGWELSSVVSGSAVVALVLAIPDMGPLFLQALKDQDMYLAGTILLILSALVIIGTLVSDGLLALLDPRIRRGNLR